MRNKTLPGEQLSNVQQSVSGLSKVRLLKGTALALVFAGFITVLFILPAEFGIDPTGMGGKFGLLKLSEGTEPLEALPARIVQGAFPEIPAEFDYDEPEVLKDPFSRIQGSDFRSDSLKIRLDVDEQVEYKVRARQGDALVYSWHVDEGIVYTDFHADPSNKEQYPENYWIRYDEVESNGAAGSLVVPFDGNHGWYWMNIHEKPVTITLELRGFYGSVDELMRSKQ